MRSEPNSSAEVSFHFDAARRFSELSGDTNLLHVEARFARGTPYGRPIVPGALAALFCLSKISSGKPRGLTSISAVFLHPLYWGRPYQVLVKKSVGATVCSVSSGRQVCCEFRFSEKPGKLPPSPARAKRLKYQFDLAKLARFLRDNRWPLHRSLYPLAQDICWVSRYSGALRPGKGGILVSFRVARASGGPSAREYLVRTGEEDPRFHLTSSRASTAHSEIEIESVKFSPVPAEPVYKSRLKFEEVKFLITGASSGIGKALRGALRAGGASVLPIQRAEVDLEDPASVAAFVRRHHAKIRKADCVILAASGTFEKIKWADVALSSWLQEVSSEIRINSFLLHDMLPSLKKGCRIVFLSSEFVGEMPVGHSSYVAAKACSEVIVNYCARENDVRVSILRLPRYPSPRSTQLVSSARHVVPLNRVLDRILRHLQRELRK